MKLYGSGNFVVCSVCNDYGPGKGKKTLQMRRPFLETNWLEHALTSIKHKIALQRLEFEQNKNNSRNRKQTSLHSFFSVKKKIKVMIIENEYNEHNIVTSITPLTDDKQIVCNLTCNKNNTDCTALILRNADNSETKESCSNKSCAGVLNFP